MRLTLIVAVSALALAATAANAQNLRPVGVQSTFTPDPVPEADVAAEAAVEADLAVAADAAAIEADGYTDAELKSFAGAMDQIQSISRAVQGGAPTAEQQTEMAAAVQASGLDVTRFNAISTAVSADAELRARVAVAAAPEPAPGSVAATVSEQELSQFAGAMARVRSVSADVQGGAPTPEQQAEMAAAVQASGLAVERFNAISTAVSEDAGLRARVQLVQVRGSM